MTGSKLSNKCCAVKSKIVPQNCTQVQYLRKLQFLKPEQQLMSFSQRWKQIIQIIWLKNILVLSISVLWVFVLLVHVREKEKKTLYDADKHMKHRQFKLPKHYTYLYFIIEYSLLSLAVLFITHCSFHCTGHLLQCFQSDQGLFW